MIREQAAEKHLDPALIAAVIYAETKFEPRPSSAGAQGLMQILPATAYYLAHLSGGSRFTAGDLATPQHQRGLRQLLPALLLDHYSGNEMLAVAAYNGGLANVDSWVAQANAAGRQLTRRKRSRSPRRAPTCSACSAPSAHYRAAYPRELGLR